MYTIDNIVTTSACGSDSKLKLFSAFQMMQDCSEMWLDSEPAFRKWFEDTGATQFLASRQVEIVRVPEYKERLATVTSVFDVKPMFGYRNTFIYDAEGRPCYKTWSIGAFALRTTGKLVRIPQDVLDTLHIESRKEMSYGERRIVPPKDSVFEEHAPVEVMRNDIDYNAHMNNANYIRIAMEYLPVGFQYDSVRVEFKRPAHLGEMILTRTCLSPNGAFYVEMYVGDSVCVILELK